MSKRPVSPSAASKRAPRSTELTNYLLAALPAAEYADVLPALELISLKLKTFLHKPGEAMQFVYFPCGGFCSVLSVLEDGGMVEVATIGREGMVGLSAIFDGRASKSVAMVQAESDRCYRMPIADFRREMNRRGTFYDVMTRYADAIVGVIMQTTACNAVHSIEQRLARWLLMAHDRIGTTTFPLTQEFVAMMLGAARPTVTVVAGTLQRAGLITYHRGMVTVLDRPGLEGASCECYNASAAILRTVSAGRVDLGLD